MIKINLKVIYVRYKEFSYGHYIDLDSSEDLMKNIYGIIKVLKSYGIARVILFDCWADLIDHVGNDRDYNINTIEDLYP